MSITSTQPRQFSWAVSSTPENVGPGLYDPTAPHGRYHAPIPFGTTARRDTFSSFDHSYSVGPGSYNPSAPARARSSLSNFSLSSERKYWEFRDPTPSPADYSSLCVWGSRPRPRPNPLNRPIPPREAFDTQDSAELPGPGSYSPQLSPNTRGSGFSLSRSPQREPLDFGKAPGPADYSISRDIGKPPPGIDTSPVFRSRQRREIFPRADYDGTMLDHVAWPAEPQSKRPFGGLTKRFMNMTVGETPAGVGPGAYSPETKRRKASRGCTFGAPRSALSASEGPGPGYYVDKRNERGASAVISRAPRTELWVQHEDAPGPGQYHTDESERLSRRAKMRTGSPAFKDKAVREGLVAKEGPGPAAYTTKVAGKKDWVVFPKAPRFGSDGEVSPGPGDYDDAREVHTTGGLIPQASRFSKQKKSTGPGPDSYQNGDKCDMIKPSFNVKFDPAQQPYQKFGADAI